MPRTKRVGLSRLANAWAEVSDSYEHAYLDKIRQFARATTPRFCVGGLGFDPRFVKARLVSQRDVDRFHHLVRGRGWIAVNGNGPEGMLHTVHREARMDALGAICTTYIVNDIADVEVLLEVVNALQLVQKVVLAKKLGRSKQFEYLHLPAALDYGYHPRIICIGRSWQTLNKLIQQFAAEGCIRNEDLELFVHVNTLEQAIEEANRDCERFLDVCAEAGTEVSTEPWSTQEERTLRELWDGALNAFEHDYLAKLARFAAMLESRIRTGGYGSHLADIGNGEAERFGREILGLGSDAVLGGGPKVMNAIANGAQDGKKSHRRTKAKKSGPTSADDEYLLLGPPIVIAMALSLPDEQTQPTNLDLMFPNRHFWKRLMGFWVLCLIHFAKRKGGFGTLLEIVWAIANALTVAKGRASRHNNAALLNQFCAEGFVPHTLAIGDMWRKVERMLEEMVERGTLTAEQAKVFRVVDDLDAGLACVRQQVTRIRRFAASHRMPLVD